MTLRWQGLLVSVRNPAEAAAAVAGGAAIIDVKEPRQGPLGRAEPEAIAAVASVVGTRRPWTMACGELSADSLGAAAMEPSPGRRSIESHLARTLSLLGQGAVPPAAVKVGLAGMAGMAWQERLHAVFAAVPGGCDRVAVAYADWQRAAAPPPEEVIVAAARLGSALLIDTFDKAGDDVFRCCPPAALAGWIAAARAARLPVAVAGRIGLEEIPAAWAFGPNVVAVRSAVCFNGRDGSVQEELVRRAVRLDGCHAAADAPPHSTPWQENEIESDRSPGAAHA